MDFARNIEQNPRLEPLTVMALRGQTIFSGSMSLKPSCPEVCHMSVKTHDVEEAVISLSKVMNHFDEC